MKKDEREKGHEQEAFDRGGVMLQDMIGVPDFDQLIKAVVFDDPLLMSKTDGTLGGTSADGVVVTHTQALVWS